MCTPPALTWAGTELSPAVKAGFRQYQAPDGPEPALMESIMNNDNTLESRPETVGNEVAPGKAKRPAADRGAAATDKSKGPKPGQKSRRPTANTKTKAVLRKLRSTKGATVAELATVTGWQQHSVRGFLSGHLKKKLGLSIASEVGKDGSRRYRIADGITAG